jgi:hypothetical protein
VADRIGAANEHRDKIIEHEAADKLEICRGVPGETEKDKRGSRRLEALGNEGVRLPDGHQRLVGGWGERERGKNEEGRRKKEEEREKG